MAVFALGLLATACNVQLYAGYAVSLKNNGRDPIHVDGVRCAQNATVFIAFVGGEYEQQVDLKLERNGIDLGKLRLYGSSTNAKNNCLVTMTEPVYFDFRFESEDTIRVRATYVKP